MGVQKAFRGEYEQKIDGKGRVSIPSSFRRVLETGDPEFAPGPDAVANLIVVYGNPSQKFLLGYSVRAMSEVDEKIRSLKQGRHRARLQRMFNTFSDELTVDQTGRLVLPKRLREKLGLAEAGTLMFAGTNETFEIWHPDAYAAMLEGLDDQGDEAFEIDSDPRMLLDMDA